MADQISRLVFDVVGRDRNGTKVLKDSATHADAAHQSFQRLGSTLSGLGGPFDQVTNLAGNLGDAMEGSLGRVQKLGLGLTATGVALIGFAAHDQQAQRQLRQSIENTGASYGDYSKQIEEAIHTQEGYAHSAADTQDALNTLTTATQDPTRAIEELGVVADIAAAKHVNLADAARTLTLAQEGNLRALRSFGISLDGNGTKTAQLNRALRQLQDRLSGQASASVDTFAGRLKVLGTRVEDDLARLGKYGPAITAVGAALTLVSTATQILAARRLADTAAAVRETAANAALAGSYDAVAASAAAAATAQGGAAAAGGAGAAIGAAGAARIVGYGGIATRLAVPAGVAYGTYKTAQDVLAKDQRGLTGEQERELKRLQSGNQTEARQVASQFGGPVEKAYKDWLALRHADKNATDKASEGSRKYATSLMKEKAAAVAATDSLGDHLKKLEDSAHTTLGLQDAESGLQGAMHDLAQSVHDGGRALEGHSAAALANRSALRAVASQELDVIQAMKDDHVGRRRIIAAADAMSTSLITNAGAVLHNRAAVRQLLRELGLLPPQIARALGGAEALSENIGEQIMYAEAAGIDRAAPAAVQAAQRAAAQIAAAQAQKGLRLGDNADGTGGAASYTPKTDTAAKRYGTNVANTVVAAYAPAVDTGIDKATSDALEKARRKAQRQRDLERRTFADVANAFRQERNQIVGGFDVTNLPTKTDSLGAAFGHGSLAHEARQFVHELETWARLLGRLRRRGLNEVMLDQFEQAGVAAIPAMREVLSHHEIRSLNRSERQIRRVAGRVAAADVSHDYQPEILHALRHLPDRLDRVLVRDLRHLHIEINLRHHSRHRGQRVRNKS